MTRTNDTVLTALVAAGFLALAGSLSAGPALSEPVDQAPQAASQQPTAKPKWVAPVKGLAEIGYLPPKTKVVGNEIVTTMKIKNLAPGSIALLRVDEFWWDKANNAIGGDTYRHKKLLMPGEVIEITLKNPKNPNYHRNNYQFSHANGQIKATVLKKIE
jgi:hypothetical protein